MRENHQAVGIAPSLMCADLLNLKQQLSIMDAFHPYWYHIDIMDGHYVPNFTFGPDLIRAVKAGTPTPLSVHLMIEAPERHIQLFAEAGADCITFHIEAVRFPIRLLNQIRSYGIKAGVVISPTTPLNSLPYLVDFIDCITVMSIEPGFAGQPYIEFTYEKIRAIHEMIKLSHKLIPIEVDGGVNLENGLKSIECGADILVAGYFSVFKKTGSLQENYLQFQSALNQAG